MQSTADRHGVRTQRKQIRVQIQFSCSEQNMQRPCDIILTFLAVLALITSIADAGAHDADAVSSAVDVDALVDRHVALGALPPAVALAAAPRVLTVPAAQHWTGSWTRHRRGDESVTQSGAIGSSGHTDEQFSLKFDRVCSDNNIMRSRRRPPASSNIFLLLHQPTRLSFLLLTLFPLPGP